MTRWTIIPLTAILIAGCVPTVETRIMSSGQPTVAGAIFSLSDDQISTPELRYAQNLVADALRAKGFTSGESAALHLEVTLAVRSASLALGTAAGPGSLSPAKRQKPLQSCDDREFRVGVALTRVADGVLAYQGSAAEYHCNLPLAEALPDLVDAALADFGNPRGGYVVSRKMRD
jgi:hypothetical protein